MFHENWRFAAVFVSVFCVSSCVTAAVALPLGDVIGDRNVRTTPQYVAEPKPVAPPEIVPLVAAQASPVESRPDVDLENIRASIQPRHLLRVRGTFGRAVGRIDSINASGLHGLNPDPRHEPGLGPVPDPIPWSSITRIDRRGHSAGTGAAIGGVAIALVSGISFGAFDESGSSSELEGGLVFLSFVAGAAVGSLIGALIPAWHPVFRVTDSREPEPRFFE